MNAIATPQRPTQTVQAVNGETLRGLAMRVFKDERIAELLSLCNPRLHSDTQLRTGLAVQLPDRAMAARWAAQKGITLGVDPTKPSGTNQKRAWSKFNTAPSCKPSPTTGPDAAFKQLLMPAAKGALGPGALTSAVLKSASALGEAMLNRMHWLGPATVMASAALLSPAEVQRRAQQVCLALKVPHAADDLVQAIVDGLLFHLGGECQKETRRLLARAQQALGATTQGVQAAMHLLACLKDVDMDARVKLLTTLTVPKAQAAHAAKLTERLPQLRGALVSAMGKPSSMRIQVLAHAGFGDAAFVALLPRLTPGMTPQTLEGLAVKAMGLEDVALRAQQGAAAMQKLVQVASPELRNPLAPQSVLAAFPAARSVVFASRGITLDAAVWPPPSDALATNLMDSAMLHAATLPTARPPEAVRVAWKLVEALGPQLSEVDASALGRGVGSLLARVTAPAETSDEVKRLRPGDLLAMSGAAVSRTQERTDTTRALAPVIASLAALEHFPYAMSAAPQSQRLELRRRLVDGIRQTYALPPNQYQPDPTAEDVRAGLKSILTQAGVLSDAYPDIESRLARLRPMLAGQDLYNALARLVGRERYHYRREFLNTGACWLVAAAWMLDQARKLPRPDVIAEALHKVCRDDGGKLMDAMERDLLRRMG